jgi:Protein of unknown function (DUF1552)
VEQNPRGAFERLFGDSNSADPAERLLRLEIQKSILDSVNHRVNRLMGRLGSSDQHKLGEYLDAVRDVERGIPAAEQSNTSAKTTLSNAGEPMMQRPAGIPVNYAERSKLMFDLMVLAYQTDLTRVISFMMGWEGNTAFAR